MTRRPPMPPDGNIRRAHQRMAPGGRLWSESPVRGPAVRTVAAGDDPELAPPVFVGMDKNAAGAPGVEAEFFAAVGVIQEGDPVLVVAFGHGTVAAPPGWTTLVSGTVTDMGYVVAWVPFVGALDGSGFYTGPLDITFPVSDTTQLLTFNWTGSGATPSATVTEYPAQDIVNVSTAAPTAAPFSVVGAQYGTGWTWGGDAGTAAWFGSYLVSGTYGLVTGDAVPAVDPAGGTVDLSAGSGSPLPDMAEFLIGWVV